MGIIVLMDQNDIVHARGDNVPGALETSDEWGPLLTLRQEEHPTGTRYQYADRIEGGMIVDPAQSRDSRWQNERDNLTAVLLRRLAAESQANDHLSTVEERLERLEAVQNINNGAS